MLYTLYNSAVSLEHLVDDSIEDKDLDQFLDEQMNPEQVSKHHRIVEQVQTYLHQALRSLC